VTRRPAAAACSAKDGQNDHEAERTVTHTPLSRALRRENLSRAHAREATAERAQRVENLVRLEDLEGALQTGEIPSDPVGLSTDERECRFVGFRFEHRDRAWDEAGGI
jgi:hypothetical protein